MKEYVDTDLGRLVFRINNRCKRVIARRLSVHYLITIPEGLSSKQIKDAVDSMKPRLLQLKARPTQLITTETTFRAFSFVAQIRQTSSSNGYKVGLRNEVLTLDVPMKADISSPEAQRIIKELITRALRYEAKRLFPDKVRIWAEKLGLKYNGLKINSSVSRWGSCSTSQNINLSLYLLLLPERFIDYVILHELAHTVEMNHSERFWKVLSDFCGEDAKALSKQMKAHIPDIYYRLVK